MNKIEILELSAYIIIVMAIGVCVWGVTYYKKDLKSFSPKKIKKNWPMGGL